VGDRPTLQHINDRYQESQWTMIRIGFGRELPSGLMALPLREVECLTAGDDSMIDGADIH
jgi:hypothetical protein